MYNHGHGPIKAFQYSLGLPQLKWIFETPSLFSNGISLLRVPHLNVEFELHCWTAIPGIMYILQNRVYPRTKSSIVLDLNWHGELTTVTLVSGGASSRAGRAAARATPLMSSVYITFDVENISWLPKNVSTCSGFTISLAPPLTLAEWALDLHGAYISAANSFFSSLSSIWVPHWLSWVDHSQLFMSAKSEPNTILSWYLGLLVL